MRSSVFGGIVVAILLLAVATAWFTTIDSKNSADGIPRSALPQIPDRLQIEFPRTNWKNVDPTIERVLSGGPGKDGIPAIDDPLFKPLSTFAHGDEVLAIVIEDGTTAKAYPYNILVWHEIVNDTVDDVPVAVTFCPLCGSAVVYDRRLPDGVTTFGVSGSLLESNLIMYDRDTESLWQQSTGKALAGDYHLSELTHVPFQILTIGEIKEKYRNALVLSENTGHTRDYARNPYAGYDTDEELYFPVSSENTAYPPKKIFVAFFVDDVPVAVPQQALTDGVFFEEMVAGKNVRVENTDGIIRVTAAGEEVPFYFEMWFSWATQHGARGVVFDPEKE